MKKSPSEPHRPNAEPQQRVEQRLGKVPDGGRHHRSRMHLERARMSGFDVPTIFVDKLYGPFVVDDRDAGIAERHQLQYVVHRQLSPPCPLR